MTRKEPGRNKMLTRGALALAVYGGFILVFW
jgi:hypothetical protein